MRSLLSILLCGAFMLTGCASTSGEKAYVGRFEYAYPGFRVMADVPDETSLSWKILEGGEVGKSATEKVERRTIALGIELAAWTESDGIVVVQVSNFNNMTVSSVLVINGKQTVVSGTIKRLD